MEHYPQGTITFVFTDIVGSTRLWERFPTAMGDAVRRHDALMREIFSSHGGYVFKTVGDACCVAFCDPGTALEAAVEVQRRIRSVGWGEIGSLSVRVAVHTGPAESRGGDYFGGTLSRVARIESAAHGGQILVSGVTKDLVLDAVPGGLRFRDLGQHYLRSLERPEQLFQILAEGLETDFPPPRSLSVLPNNLPVQSTSFLGRDNEMRMVLENLEGRTRLLTLTGAGGTGKTRLAVEAGAALVGAFRGGVWLVELATISDASRILPAMATVFSLREEAGRTPRDTLIDALSGREMLLVLDNCEQISGAVASLVSELLRSCEKLKVLATSRHSLGISGESVLNVPPLPTYDIHRERLHGPALLQRLAKSDAVNLFIDRAAAIRPDFLLSVENAPHVAEICGRLDGIPLAIELAAARLRVLDIHQIAGRIEDRFRLLRGGGVDRLPHQQTLRALIDWSYDLLSESERILFRRLGVFIGGRSLEAIEDVCEGGGIDAGAILDLLDSLVDKSLLVVEPRTKGDPRYTMLESVWHYARQKLHESGEEEILRERHMNAFLEWAEKAEREFEAHDQAQWLECFDEELFNLDAALRWCIRHRRKAEAMRMLTAVGRAFEVRGYLMEGREHAAAILRMEGDVPIRLVARVHSCAGRLAWALDLHDEALLHFREAEQKATLCGDRTLAAFCLGFIGFVVRGQGDIEQSERIFHLCLATANELGNEKLAAMSMSGLGRVAISRGDLTKALELSEAALVVYKRCGDLMVVALILEGIARACIRLPDLRRAGEAACQWSLIADDLGNDWMVPYILSVFASIAMRLGEPKRAAVLFAAAEVLRENHGFRFSPEESEEHKLEMESLRTALSADQFDESWREGRGADPLSLIKEARRDAMARVREI